jgi:hypothetical protein
MAAISIPKGYAYRMGLNQMVRALRDSILETGILKADEFDQSLRQCEMLMNDPNVLVTSYTLIQIWGRVPNEK